jgi:hypothetical protein
VCHVKKTKILEKFKAFETILTNLNILRYIISSKIKRADYSVNKQVEGFYCDLLNLMYGWNLEKPDSPIYPAIDLESKTSNLGVQVTSQKGFTKVQKTLTLFDKHHFKKLNRVIILNILSKTNHTKDFKSKVSFDKSNDIIDIDDILNEIENFDTIKIKEIESFIIREIPYYMGKLTTEDDLLRNRIDFRNIKPKNCEKFIELSDDISDLLEFKNEIENLHSKLLKLSNRQRMGVFAFLSKSNKDILEVPINTWSHILIDSFGFKSHELSNLLAVIEENLLLYNDEADINPKIQIQNEDLWRNILFLINDNNLHDFICNVNFSYLDK